MDPVIIGSIITAGAGLLGSIFKGIGSATEAAAESGADMVNNTPIQSSQNIAGGNAPNIVSAPDVKNVYEQQPTQAPQTEAPKPTEPKDEPKKEEPKEDAQPKPEAAAEKSYNPMDNINDAGNFMSLLARINGGQSNV